ncbi:MAG: glycosyltransferase [Cyclobacteriaceae bacterium]
MTNTVALSIITPCLNEEFNISRCLKSTENCSDYSIEHIIVDGGSTDSTESIANSYGHIRWVTQKSDGIYGAMNEGVRLAKGTYLFFLGADDQVLLDSLKMAIDHCSSETVLVVGKVDFKDDNPSFSLGYLINQNISHQAIIYHASVFEKYGKYSTKYPIWADYEFNLRLSDRIKPDQINYEPTDFAILGEFGLSSKKLDKAFLCDKVEIVRNYASLENFKKFGPGLYPQCSIDNLLFGSIWKGMVYGMYSFILFGKFIYLTRVLTFLKERLLGRTDKYEFI